METNNKSEKWIKWTPLSCLSQQCTIDSITDTLEEFEVLLSTLNKKNKVLVKCSFSPLAYQRINGLFKDNFLDQVSEQYQKMVSEWPFFEVVNSSYLKWLSEQSHTISDYIQAKHFCIIAENSIVDIVDTGDPCVELINEQ